MPDFDWTLFGKINGWQTVATIAVIVIALFIIARFLMRFWPWLKKVIALGDALAQLPAFIDRTDKKIEEIHHETHHNNGSSLKDAQVRTEHAVERIELGMKSLHDKVDDQKTTLEAADEAIRKDLEQTRPPRKPRTPKTKE